MVPIAKDGQARHESSFSNYFCQSTCCQDGNNFMGATRAVECTIVANPGIKSESELFELGSFSIDDLRNTPERAPEAKEKLEANWLGVGVEHHGHTFNSESNKDIRDMQSSKQSSRAAELLSESMDIEDEHIPIHCLVKVIISGLISAILAGCFSSLSLALSAIWAVPGHQDSSFWGGFMNRCIWAFSPAFLGSFFPGLCNPELMLDWRNHLFFLSVSLTPFVIADVAFPYVVGSDTNFEIFFSTCFWPTTTCLFFLPSMIAGIRRVNGDPKWLELRSQCCYIWTRGRAFFFDLLRLVACFAAAVWPVNYLAIDFAIVLPNLHPNAAAVVRPTISLIIKVGCFEIFKFCASGLGKSMMLYGIFPLALNIGLHGAMSAVLCQDWLSVWVWIFCDGLTCIWRTQRVRFRHMECLTPCLHLLPWLNEDNEQIRRRGFESIILGWGLTGALAGVLMVYPFTGLLPDMLHGLLFPQGTTSLMYLAVVSIADVLLDMVALVLLSYTCRYDFGKILGYQPFSETLRYAYLSSLTVVWAPCALGCFGWVAQHMCVAVFEKDC